MCVACSNASVQPCDEDSSQLAWEVIIVDDASPDGTQEVARQLANVYGEDKIVSCIGISVVAVGMLKPYRRF